MSSSEDLTGFLRLRTTSLYGIVPPKGDEIGEEKEKIRVRALNTADWQDLRAIWTNPLVIEGTKRRALCEGNMWTPARWPG
jgi:hypothetical protein